MREWGNQCTRTYSNEREGQTGDLQLAVSPSLLALVCLKEDSSGRFTCTVWVTQNVISWKLHRPKHAMMEWAAWIVNGDGVGEGIVQDVRYSNRCQTYPFIVAERDPIILAVAMLPSRPLVGWNWWWEHPTYYQYLFEYGTWPHVQCLSTIHQKRSKKLDLVFQWYYDLLLPYKHH